MKDTQLRALQTPPRLDAAGLVQRSDQRNPDEFAQPLSAQAVKIHEFLAAYPDDMGTVKRAHSNMARGHVRALGVDVAVTLRRVAQMDREDVPNVLREMARKVVANMPPGEVDDELEDKLVSWLLLATMSVV